MNKNEFVSKYRKLLIISIVFKAIAIIFVCFSIVVLVYSLTIYTEQKQELIYFIVTYVCSIISSIGFFVFAELIKIIVKIEFNTSKDNSFDITKPCNADISYNEWKKENPSKSLNDYYASKK